MINSTTVPHTFLSQTLAVQNSDPVDPIGTHALSRPKRGLADPQLLWPQFSRIKVSMTDLTQEQKEFTKDNINKWAPHVNLEFEFTEQQDGDIRIKGNNDIDGGYSYVGIEAKRIDVDKPTMEIGFLGGLNEFNAGTVIHEFGHALGLHHEHQHPSHTLDFNVGKIKQDTQYDKDPTLFELAYGPITGQLASTAYDQKSVMHYGIPQERLNSGERIEDNNELSEGDKEIASLLYPKPEQQLLPFLFSVMLFPYSLSRAILERT